jgi:hypothetical protein
MSSKQQYVTELNEHDIILGRGSGPNDRQGNINFRLLCKERKIAYIEAKSRDEKGRIAADIVKTVHDRGGRFLKKLSPEQAKSVGFQRGEVVYELADEQPILEKTKQTLRQNRADFVAKVEKEEGRAPVVGAYPIQRKVDDTKQKKDNNKSKANNVMSNFDPIPLGQTSAELATIGVDSAVKLLNSLFGFASSENSQEHLKGGQKGFAEQSDVSALSDMSGLLYDALDLQSKGLETDSTLLYKSILKECSANEQMAEELVSVLLKDSKSEQSTPRLTGEQRALLLQYEQMKYQQWMQEQQQLPQQQQHPFGQLQYNNLNAQKPAERPMDTADSLFSQGSVFSSLVRQYADHNQQIQECDEQGNYSANSSDPTVNRRPSRRATLDGGETIEPSNYMDETMNISYQAAKELAKTLGGSSFSMSVKSREFSSSSSRGNRKRHGSLDSSLQSLMSMSISEITHPGPLKSREESRGSRDPRPAEVRIRADEFPW